MIAAPISRIGNGHGVSQRGFSLVELAVVVTIVALMLATAMYTLSAQTEQRAFTENRQRLSNARELLLAFAVVHGRLPCPAVYTGVTSTGDESPPTGGICTNPYGGYLPGRSIGYQPVNSKGYALDVWGNRIRYAVSNLITGCTGTSTTPHFTDAANLKGNGISCLPYDLVVCDSATGINPGATPPSCGSAGSVTNQKTVVAIVFSTGKDYLTPTAGNSDEAANTDGDAVFVDHELRPGGATGGEFDDQMVWIPVGELYSKLISAGVLP